MIEIKPSQENFNYESGIFGFINKFHDRGQIGGCADHCWFWVPYGQHSTAHEMPGGSRKEFFECIEEQGGHVFQFTTHLELWKWLADQ